MTYSKNEILKMVWAHCLDCCCGDRKEVRFCPCEKCPLHPIRNRASYSVREDKEEPSDE